LNFAHKCPKRGTGQVIRTITAVINHSMATIKADYRYSCNKKLGLKIVVPWPSGFVFGDHMTTKFAFKQCENGALASDHRGIVAGFREKKL